MGGFRRDENTIALQVINLINFLFYNKDNERFGGIFLNYVEILIKSNVLIRNGMISLECEHVTYSSKSFQIPSQCML